MPKRLSKRFTLQTDRNNPSRSPSTTQGKQSNPTLPAGLYPQPPVFQRTVTFTTEVSYAVLTHTWYASLRFLQLSSVNPSNRHCFPRIYFNTQSILRSVHAIHIATLQPDLGDCLQACDPLTNTAAEQYLDILTAYPLNQIDPAYWLAVMHEGGQRTVEKPNKERVEAAILEMRDVVSSSLRTWGCMVRVDSEIPAID